jgi:hypothetical protein
MKIYILIINSRKVGGSGSLLLCFLLLLGFLGLVELRESCGLESKFGESLELGSVFLVNDGLELFFDLVQSLRRKLRLHMWERNRHRHARGRFLRCHLYQHLVLEDLPVDSVVDVDGLLASRQITSPHEDFGHVPSTTTSLIEAGESFTRVAASL